MIKRWVATKDTTITNAFRENLLVRGTNANMGASDILEIFNIYAQATTSSIEQSRILLEFPIEEVASARQAGELPDSGNVAFYLKLTNARHGGTTPKNYSLQVQGVSRQWEEGDGLDMESYSDIDVANWVSASSTEAWTQPGGDYHPDRIFTQFLQKGDENLEVNITSLVEDWLNGDKDNDGLSVSLSGSLSGGDKTYYTKKFFSRTSQFPMARPFIEARWDSSIRDDRENFYVSSSNLPAQENLNTLYLYNKFGGQYYNIPAVGTGSIYVSLSPANEDNTGPLNERLTLHNGLDVVEGTWVREGVYRVNVAVDTTSSIVYDTWHNNALVPLYNVYSTGTPIYVYDYKSSHTNENKTYTLSMRNLKQSYSNDEIVEFRLHAKDKDWLPTVYNIASSELEKEPLEEAYYKIQRVQDNFEVIPYGTGSTNHTLLSYDKDGNYFNLDMSLFEKGYMYEISYLYRQYGMLKEHKDKFRFRVE